VIFRHHGNLLSGICKAVVPHAYIQTHTYIYIQGVTGGTDQTSGECSLGQTIPI